MGWLAICSGIICISPGESYAVETHQAQDTDARRAILREWLEKSGLGTYLELVRIRSVPHPLAEGDDRVLALELRSKPIGDDAVYDLAYLDSLNSRFQRQHGASLWDRLLFKFVHVFRIPLDSGIV